MDRQRERTMQSVKVSSLPNAPVEVAEVLRPAAEVFGVVAKEHGCSAQTHVGVDALCSEGPGCFPQVAAVGMAAAPGREPRVVEWTWGEDNKEGREVVIIGKGITFDTENELRKIAQWHPQSECVLRIRSDDPEAGFSFGIKFGADGQEVPGLLLLLVPEGSGGKKRK